MRVNIINYIEKSRSFLLMFIALLLPISKQIVPILIILLVVSWLLSGNLIDRLKGLKRNGYMWLFAGYYLLHVVGMLYTSNMEFGLYDLEIKMSFFLFPLVLASLPRLTRSAVHKISMAFILGCGVAAIANLIIAYGNYSESGEVNDLLYGGLSHFHHTSYYSMYLCLALVMIFYYLIHPLEHNPKWSSWILALLVPFFIMIIIILMAKSGVLTLGVILLATLLYLLFMRRFTALLILSSFIAIGSGGALYYTPDAFKRIESTWIVASQSPENRDLTSAESTAGRIMVWEQAIGLIKDNWVLGVGTGDIKDELVSRYRKEGYTGIEEKQLNAHNQFLQSFGALGVFGFLALALGLILPAIHAIRKKHFVYFMFILIIIVNAMTESILEVQAGVVFYAFFNSLFMFSQPDSPQPQE